MMVVPKVPFTLPMTVAGPFFITALGGEVTVMNDTAARCQYGMTSHQFHALINRI